MPLPPQSPTSLLQASLSQYTWRHDESPSLLFWWFPRVSPPSSAIAEEDAAIPAISPALRARPQPHQYRVSIVSLSRLPQATNTLAVPFPFPSRPPQAPRIPSAILLPPTRSIPQTDDIHPLLSACHSLSITTVFALVSKKPPFAAGLYPSIRVEVTVTNTVTPQKIPTTMVLVNSTHVSSPPSAIGDDTIPAISLALHVQPQPRTLPHLRIRSPSTPSLASHKQRMPYRCHF